MLRGSRTGAIRRELFTDGPSHGISQLGVTPVDDWLVGTCYGQLYHLDANLDVRRGFRLDVPSWHSNDVVRVEGGFGGAPPRVFLGSWGAGYNFVTSFSLDLRLINWQQKIPLPELGCDECVTSLAEGNLAGHKVLVVGLAPYWGAKCKKGSVWVLDGETGQPLRELSLPETGFAPEYLVSLNRSGPTRLAVLGHRIGRNGWGDDRLFLVGVDGEITDFLDLGSSLDRTQMLSNGSLAILAESAQEMDLAIAAGTSGRVSIVRINKERLRNAAPLCGPPAGKPGSAP